MTWGNPPPFKATPPIITGKKLKPEQLTASGSEHGEQAALFCWAADSVGRYPQLAWMFAIPNGFFGDSGQKAKMKAEGLRSGVCDVFLPYAPPWHNKYHGCFIEMKIERHRNTKNGGCSQEQLDFIKYITNAGYYCKVCYNWTEARDAIIAYLEGSL